MALPPRIKRFCTFCCVLLTMAFNCQATGGETQYQNQALSEARKILEFICSKISCKPHINEQSQENYLNEIMRCLDNKQVFNKITKSLVENNPLPHKPGLTSGERGLLLSLCLYQYCKNTGLYWSEVSESIGVFPDLNIYFDAVNSSGKDYTGYDAYQLTPNKALVLQLTGRGNHNHSYFLWHVKIEDGKFHAALLDVPSFSHEKSLSQTKPEFLAKRCFYDSQQMHFIIHVNTGDVHGWQETENIYQIKDDKLVLLQSSIHEQGNTSNSLPD